MEQYQIEKLPIAYNNPGVAITPTLFVWHSTDNPEVSAHSHYVYWNTANRNTSSNYVLDDTEIIELIPPGMESWNCGPNGNPISIACEICEFADPGKFLESMKRARFLWQTIQQQFPNLQPVSHAWITENLKGTDHMDPISYLESHQWTWQMFLDYINSEDGGDQVVDAWKQQIMDKADAEGLLDKTQHAADDAAPNWFVAAVALRLLDKINGK